MGLSRHRVAFPGFPSRFREAPPEPENAENAVSLAVCSDVGRFAKHSCVERPIARRTCIAGPVALISAILREFANFAVRRKDEPPCAR